MIEFPYTYKLINELNIQNIPSTLHLKDNKTYQYFVRYLLQKAMSVYKFSVPDWWSIDYFLYVLFCQGFVCIFDDKKYGVIPQQCTLSGLNVFYEPKKAIVANPVIGTLDPMEIDSDCVVIKMMPDYSGIMDLVSRYAAQMALCTEAFEINTCNTKLAYVFSAKDKASAKSFGEMFDRINAGEPALAVGEKLFDDFGKPLWTTFAQNLASTYIAPDILTTLKRVEANYDTEIGIPNANTDKRERLISDEVNANNVETYSKASLWLDNIKQGCKKCNEMFGIKITAGFRNPTEPKGEKENATVDINTQSMDSGQYNI